MVVTPLSPLERHSGLTGHITVQRADQITRKHRYKTRILLENNVLRGYWNTSGRFCSTQIDASLTLLTDPDLWYSPSTMDSLRAAEMAAITTSTFLSGKLRPPVPALSARFRTELSLSPQVLYAASPWPPCPYSSRRRVPARCSSNGNPSFSAAALKAPPSPPYPAFSMPTQHTPDLKQAKMAGCRELLGWRRWRLCRTRSCSWIASIKR